MDVDLALVPHVVEEQLKVQDVTSRGQPKGRVRDDFAAHLVVVVVVVVVVPVESVLWRAREHQALAATCEPGLLHDRRHHLVWQLEADLVARAEGHLGDALQDVVWEPTQRTLSSASLNRAEQEGHDLLLLHPVGAVLETTLHRLGLGHLEQRNPKGLRFLRFLGHFAKAS